MNKDHETRIDIEKSRQAGLQELDIWAASFEHSFPPGYSNRPYDYFSLRSFEWLLDPTIACSDTLAECTRILFRAARNLISARPQDCTSLVSIQIEWPSFTLSEILIYHEKSYFDFRYNTEINTPTGATLAQRIGVDVPDEFTQSGYIQGILSEYIDMEEDDPKRWLIPPKILPGLPAFNDCDEHQIWTFTERNHPMLASVSAE